MGTISAAFNPSVLLPPENIINNTAPDFKYQCAKFASAKFQNIFVSLILFNELYRLLCEIETDNLTVSNSEIITLD